MMMNIERATEILGADVRQPDGSLDSLVWYLCWRRGNGSATLDGSFTADELEAIAVWMRAHP